MKILPINKNFKSTEVTRGPTAFSHHEHTQGLQAATAPEVMGHRSWWRIQAVGYKLLLALCTVQLAFPFIRRGDRGPWNGLWSVYILLPHDRTTLHVYNLATRIRTLTLTRSCTQCSSKHRHSPELGMKPWQWAGSPPPEPWVLSLQLTQHTWTEDFSALKTCHTGRCLKLQYTGRRNILFI